jgi:6-phosphogluconolactonase
MAVMRNNTEIKILPNSAEVFQEAAADFARRAESAIKSKGVFTVVLAGGNTAKLFFDILAESYKQQISWEQIRFFFGDERYIPATDSENNYHIANEHLFTKVGVPEKNIHRIQTEFPDPLNSAEDYEHTLREFFSISNNEFPQFDVIYLGLGENAHTASLMPLSDIVIQSARNPATENNQLVAALWVPELNMYRITLTPNAINHSKHIIFLVTGQSKALAVQEVLEGPRLPEQYPAQIIHPVNGKTTWYLDQAAAKKLT